MGKMRLLAAAAAASAAALALARRRKRRALAAELRARALPLSRDDIIIGCSPLAGMYRELPEAAAHAAVRVALARGFRCFDTAPHYGLGLSEQRLGDALSRYCEDDDDGGASAASAASAAASAAPLGDGLAVPLSALRVWSKVGRVVVPRGARRPGDDVELASLPENLSLIHISEPTRPY